MAAETNTSTPTSERSRVFAPSRTRRTGAVPPIGPFGPAGPRSRRTRLSNRKRLGLETGGYTTTGMEPERSIGRRRFVSRAGALCLLALAGCTDDGEDADDGANATEDDGENGTEAGIEAGDENETEAVEEEPPAPEIEGANVFVEVVDGEGTPIPGATVTVTGGTYDGATFETDAGGGVILQDVELGEYVIAATTDAGEDERTVSIEEEEDAHVTLRVPAPAEGAGSA